MSSHLEHVVPVGEFTRDRLREELGGYAYGAILLDGVATEQHITTLVNSPYYVESRILDQPTSTQQETLF